MIYRMLPPAVMSYNAAISAQAEGARWGEALALRQ